MILDDIVSLLRESSRNAYVTNDERVDNRLWEDFVMLKRNKYIKNYYNQKSQLEQNTLQFEILDVSKYDSALDLGGVSIGKYILRSDLCPALIEGNSGVAIYEITTVDAESKTIQPVSFDRLRWCGNGITNKDKMFAAFYDGRFYIKSGTEITKPLSKIRVVGVFADPTQVSTYNRDTDDYPINDYMIDYLKAELLQNDFNILQQTKTDELNDSSGKVQA